jgi:hypothetical protein
MLRKLQTANFLKVWGNIKYQPPAAAIKTSTAIFKRMGISRAVEGIGKSERPRIREKTSKEAMPEKIMGLIDGRSLSDARTDKITVTAR